MFTQSSIFLLLVTVACARWCCDQPADFDERMARLIEYNNYNNDSYVDLSDINYDLELNYDKNKDNKTSKVEWVLARECLYGEDSGLALFLFERIDSKDKDGFITLGDFAKGPVGTAPGMPVTAFAARSKQRYQEYKAGLVIGK